MGISTFRIVAAAGAAWLLAPGIVRAQSLLQPAPMTYVDKAAPQAAAPGPIAQAKPAAAPKAAAAALPGGYALRHLPNNAEGLRLPGEIATSEWPIYLTQAQAARELRFQVGFLSAISNLPDASRLLIQVNDVTIGEVKIDAPYKVKVATFDIPADLVRPGFNALRMVAQHRHRADCSLTATYELWTQIDATQTGMLIPAADISVNSIADIPALSPGVHGAMPIHAILPAATSTAAIDRVIRVAEQIAIQGRFEQPLVDVGDSAADGTGVNLAVGTHDQLVARKGLESIPVPDGPQLELLPATAASRATLLVSGRTPAEVDEAVARFAEGRDSTGTRQGMRAARAFPGYRVEGGAHLRLRDLGTISQEFSGRLFRTNFDIVMPSDFYPADYAKVEINLAGAYAGGLGPGAQIVVSVNNKIAVGSPLGRAGGEVFKARSITFPLGVLHPGLNRIGLEAQLPMPEDAGCETTSAADAKKRFLFLDDTEIVIPEIARVALSPNLSITATGGFPYAALRSVSHLFIPRPDPDTVGAAATLVARMALSAGRSMNFQMTQTPPSVEDGSTLAIGAAQAFAPAALAVAGLDPDAVKSIWQTAKPESDDPDRRLALSKYERLNAERIALQRNFPAECRMRIPRAKPALSAFAAVLPETPAAAARPAPAVKPAIDLAQQWDQSLGTGGGWMSKIALPSFDASFVWSAYDWTADLIAKGRDRIVSRIGSPASPVTGDAALLMAQSNHGQAGEGIWTIVTGATPQSLREGVSCLVDPRVWTQLKGEVAALNSSTAKIASVEAADPRFINTQPLSYSNVRLIAAGWFSLNIWAFILTIVAAALTLAVVTLVCVRKVGRPT